MKTEHHYKVLGIHVGLESAPPLKRGQTKELKGHDQLWTENLKWEFLTWLIVICIEITKSSVWSKDL